MHKDKYDAAFSNYIRKKAAYKCEHCKKTFEPYLAHCAHIHSRKKQAVRLDPDNALCLCLFCHRHFTDNPNQFETWLIEYKGKEHLDRLRVKANQIKKWRPGEKEKLIKNLAA